MGVVLVAVQKLSVYQKEKDMVEILKEVLPVGEVSGWFWRKVWSWVKALGRWFSVECSYWRYHRGRLTRRGYRRELALTKAVVARMGK